MQVVSALEWPSCTTLSTEREKWHSRFSPAPPGELSRRSDLRLCPQKRYGRNHVNQKPFRIWTSTLSGVGRGTHSDLGFLEYKVTPPPAVLAAEIAEDLQSALTEIQALTESLVATAADPSVKDPLDEPGR